MLTITNAAWERLSKLQSTRPEVASMRLKVEGGRLRAHKGTQRKNDQVIDHPGRPTLLMTAAVAADLSARTLDAPETKSGPRLRLQ